MPFKQKSLILLTISALFCITFGNSIAATSNSNQLSFDNWVERVKKQAQGQGISDITLNNVFSNVQQVQTGTKTNNNISTEQFLNSTLANKHVKINKRLVSHYSDVLFEIKHLFGVNPEVIIALWGIDNTQNNNAELVSAIDVLASLSYKEPANKKFKNELFQALKIIDDGQASNHQLKSDFSGRLGSMPFKPTAFRNYAIDYDGDGKYDVWQNHADIFASTANYLNNIGWKTGEPWGIEIKLPMDFDARFAGLNQQRKTSQWQDIGVRMADGSDLPTMIPEMSSIVSPSTRDATAYLVFDNYFALLRWKRSQQFAFAVGMMVDKIKQPNEITPLTPFADVSQ